MHTGTTLTTKLIDDLIEHSDLTRVDNLEIKMRSHVGWLLMKESVFGRNWRLKCDAKEDGCNAMGVAEN
eukprot:3871650-Amphidinium_carterae.1